MNESLPSTDKSRDSKDGPDAQESAGLAMKDPKNTDHPTGVEQATETLQQSHQADLTVGSLVPADPRPT